MKIIAVFLLVLAGLGMFVFGAGMFTAINPNPVLAELGKYCFIGWWLPLILIAYVWNWRNKKNIFIISIIIITLLALLFAFIITLKLVNG